jgi:hypothetical protein
MAVYLKYTSLYKTAYVCGFYKQIDPRSTVASRYDDFDFPQTTSETIDICNRIIGSTG